jgi:hypothetical protein
VEASQKVTDTWKARAIGVGAILVVLMGVVALTVGPWVRGPQWQVYGDESRLTTPAQERAAMGCAPARSSVVVLAIFPGEIDISLHGSSGRANHVAQCLRNSPGIIDATAIKSK